MSEYNLTPPKQAEAVVGAYKKIEETVVGAYKKVEDTVVGGYKQIEDGFVEKFLTHEGETAEDAKKRLAEEQAQRAAAAKEAEEKRSAEMQARIHSGTDIGRASVKRSLETARASVEASRNAGKH